MHLTIRERERIELFQIAEFARRRLTRGARISAPEAVAVVCDHILELAWDGQPYDEVVAAAYTCLEADQLMPGVANAVPQIQVEALFPEGTALIAVDRPFGPLVPDGPGALNLGAEAIEINQNRPTTTLTVTNTSDRPVFVSSHFPFDQVNSDLHFDREAASGLRLDIPAGSSGSFAAGATEKVTLIPIRRDVHGGPAVGTLREIG